MARSKIDTQIKNARLAIERARGPQHRARAEKQLQQLLVRKDQLKVTGR